MIVPVTNLWDDNTSYEEKITWIKNNQHVCLNPFQTYYYQIEFDGQRFPKFQKTVLNNSCCCSIKLNADIEKIKNNVFNGTLGEECQVCWNSEAQTGTSERTMSLINLPVDDINNFIESGNTDGFHYRIKFSNLCNLACRTCSPTFSSKYAQTYKSIIPQELYNDISSNPAVWTSITNSIIESCKTHSLVTVTLLGGESLIQPGAVKLIDWLVDNQLPVSLNITTNLTNLNTKVVKRLHQIKHIEFALSIDSVNNNYEYVRWPAKFSTIEKNLAVISTYTNTSLTIQPVWSLNNIFYINEFLDWWHKWFTTNKEILIKNVVMHRPHFMTIQNLPVRYRRQLLEVLTNALSHPIFNSHLQESLHHYILGITDFLKTESIIYDHFDLFLHETAKQDRATNSDFKIGNWRFYNILTLQDQHLYDQHPNLKLLPTEQQTMYNLHLPL